jgi:type I restriction enzyme, S subunit
VTIETKSLGLLLSALIDYRGKTPPKTASGVPLITAKVIKGGRIDTSRMEFIAEDYYDEWMRRGIPAEGDILITTEAPLGEVAAIRGVGRIALAQRVILLRANPDEVDPRFLFYYLQSPEAQARLTERASGTTVTGIRQPELRAVKVGLLPKEAQRVVAFVLTAIDDLIENNRRRVELLEQMAQAIYREWFVHFRYPGHEHDELVDSLLGPIPSGWTAVVTGELIRSGTLEIGDGYRAKNSEMSDEGLPFVRVANVQAGHVDFSGCDYLPAAYASKVGSKVSRAGDCVISMKGTVGRMTVFDERSPASVYSPQVSYWRSLDIDRVALTYLRSWMASEDFRLQCARVKGATDMADYVNLKDQRSMVMLLPNSAVQRDFTECAGPMLGMTSSLRYQMANLVGIRDLLLPGLVTGRIDVSRLNLESLLEGAGA